MSLEIDQEYWEEINSSENIITENKILICELKSKLETIEKRSRTRKIGLKKLSKMESESTGGKQWKIWKTG